MKTAISIPDQLYESIETFLKNAGMSRSEFFQRAARLYLGRVSARALVRNLDRVYGNTEPSPGDTAFLRAAESHLGEVLEEDEW